MKNLFLLTLLLFATNNTAFSQWAKIYGTESPEFSKGLIGLNDGYAMLAVQSSETWFLRTELNGDTLWTKKNYDKRYDRFVKSNNDGFYLIKDYGNSSYLTITVNKIDGNGNNIWQKNIERGQKISYMGNDTFIILSRPSDTTFVLQKLSQNGDITWDKEYSIEKNHYWNTKNIFVDDNSNIIVSIVPYSPCCYESTILNILKTDNNGNSIWNNPFYGIKASSINVNKLRNGNYIFAGNSKRYVSGNDDKSYLLELDSSGNKISLNYLDRNRGKPYPINDSNFVEVVYEDSLLIIKRDKNHNIIWEKAFSDFISFPYIPQIVDITNNNNIIIADNDELLGPILVKINSNGEFIWQKSIQFDSVSWISHTSIISINEDEFIVSGGASMPRFNTDIILEKVYSPTKVELLFYPRYPKDIDSHTDDSLFTKRIEVKIISNIFNSNIYYTLDGSEPTQQANYYTSPFIIDSTTTIKAIAFANNYETSEIINKEFRFAQKFNVNLEQSYIGIDSNFTGSALIDIQIPTPTSSLGSVASLRWLLNSNAIGEGNNRKLGNCTIRYCNNTNIFFKLFPNIF